MLPDRTSVPRASPHTLALIHPDSEAPVNVIPWLDSDAPFPPLESALAQPNGLLAAGADLSPSRIVFRHLLPNCLPPMIVVATVQVAAAIALEATLSFLGLGLPITEPSLGLLIANGYQYLLSGKYWISFFPGLALLLTIVSINLVADQLRDVLNPRLQR